MKVAGIEFNLKYNALEIYISGCKGHPCDGCHNPKLWSFDKGEYFNRIMEDRLTCLINNSPTLIKRIWILGGEPTDTPARDLSVFLYFLSKFDKEIWLWTRKDVKDISPSVLTFVTYVKSGKYDKNLPSYVDETFGIELASNNQKIIKIR